MVWRFLKVQGRALTRSCRWSIYRPPFFQLSETHKNKKKQLLGFSFLPDDHYNPYLSSGEKVNPQRCFIYFYGTWKVEKEVVNILTSRHERVNPKKGAVETWDLGLGLWTWAWYILWRHSPAFLAIPVRGHREAEEAARLAGVHHAVTRVQVEAGHACDPEEEEAGHQVAHDEPGHKVTGWCHKTSGSSWCVDTWVTMLIRAESQSLRVSCQAAESLNSSLCQKRKLRLRWGGRHRRQDTWWRLRLHFQALDLKIYRSSEFWTMIKFRQSIVCMQTLRRGGFVTLKIVNHWNRNVQGFEFLPFASLSTVSDWARVKKISRPDRGKYSVISVCWRLQTKGKNIECI